MNSNAIESAVLDVVEAAIPGITRHVGEIMLDSIAADTMPLAMTLTKTIAKEAVDVARQENVAMQVPVLVVGDANSDAGAWYDAIEAALAADRYLANQVDWTTISDATWTEAAKTEGRVLLLVSFVAEYVK